MRSYLISVIFLFIRLNTFSQDITQMIQWYGNAVIDGNTVLSFQDAQYKDTLYFPYYLDSLNISTGEDISYKLSGFKTEIIPSDSLINILNISLIPTDFYFDCKKINFSNRSITLMPVRRNPSSGVVERITEFTLAGFYPPSNQNWAANSVLRSGKWIKIKVSADGVYKLTYSELAALGISNPGNVRLYGYGSGMLPRDNSVPRPSDLQELPVMFVEQQSGNFKDGDYIAFYAEGSTQWSYNKATQMFLHTLHSFSDGAYYFLTSDLGRGKTISPLASLSATPKNTVTSFDDFAFHENEDRNLCMSGSRWFGETFNSQLSYDFPFQFSNLSPSTARLQVTLAWQSPIPTAMDFLINGVSMGSQVLEIAEGKDCTYRGTRKNFTFIPSADVINVNLSYDKKSSGTASAVLDAIDVNVRRDLIMDGSQMQFCDINSVGIGNISKFELNNVSQDVSAWEITKIEQVASIQGTLSGSSFSFTLATDLLRKFIAFDSKKLLTPIITGSDIGAVIENQDLHGIDIPNLLIITHPDFKVQAERLASHRRSQGLKVTIVTPQQIYNEFSSGSPDVQAIRDFARMLHDKDAGTFKYMLLFGDGSWDNRPVKTAGNTDFIITYLEDNLTGISLMTPITDDFFGCLSSDEKADSGYLDIGIGRFPVFDTNQANTVVDKVIHYDSPETVGNWRNNLCFIADDREDLNFTFLLDADYTAKEAEQHLPELNITKIYLDAFKQIISSSGSTCPEATRALSNIVNRGTTMLNFTGHGGADGISSEEIFTRDVIDTWNNKDKMFLIFTGSCKVTWFDKMDYANGKYTPYITAGEAAFLKENGGAICLVSTNRDTYSGGNISINNALIKYLVNRDSESGTYRLGDIYLRAKNLANNVGYNGKDENTKNFILIGDPSMVFAIPPLNRVVTDSVNGKSPEIDTVSAFKNVSINGHIIKPSGTIQDDFNGAIAISVFEKPMKWESLSNHGFSIDTFYTQEQTIIKGNASVQNGYFSFRFMVPKDINYRIGTGKISYYAKNETSDLNGFNNKVKVGGFSDHNMEYNADIKIRLYMNDTTFRNGGITDDSPTMLAIISAKCGINSTGAAIGHDVSAFLDGNEKEMLILNDYFETDLDDYQKGSIRYPLSGLSPGRHTLHLMVWDAMNNNSESDIEFIVTSGNELKLQNIICYPNPMSHYTNFVFDHNMPDEEMKVTIQIFDMAGSLVQTLVQNINSSGYTSTPIMWDGSTPGGYNITSGIYIYRITAEIPKEGLSAIGSGKLFIAR